MTVRNSENQSTLTVLSAVLTKTENISFYYGLESGEKSFN